MAPELTPAWCVGLGPEAFYRKAREEMPRMSRMAEDERRGPRMNEHRLTKRQRERLSRVQEE